jgi:hypothetical protein
MVLLDRIRASSGCASSGDVSYMSAIVQED